jgi:hypothetical protein
MLLIVKRSSVIRAVQIDDGLANIQGEIRLLEEVSDVISKEYSRNAPEKKWLSIV